MTDAVRTEGYAGPDPIVLDACAKCGTDIRSGDPVVVAPDGGRWHPQCRAAVASPKAKPRT